MLPGNMLPGVNAALGERIEVKTSHMLLEATSNMLPSNMLHVAGQHIALV